MMDISFFSFDTRNRDLREQTMKCFEKFFDSNYYVLGEFTDRFERAYALFNEVRYAVGVSSGLDALHLSLLALNIGPGDEVIVPSNTYIATVLAISYAGATPVFVEPRIETANLNPDLITQAITSKTKCIMPVHLYGQACEMHTIIKIANDYNLFVVEDNAQAHGAVCKGKKTGSFGHINATSFYPTKNLGSLGEAGAITTNTAKYANRIRLLRNYGSERRYYNEEIGYNNRIDEFEAAFLGIAIEYLEKWNLERERIADLYRSLFNESKSIKLLEVAPGCTTVNHLFVIKTGKRDELRSFLAERGIGTQIHYPIPPHLQKAYAYLGFNKGDFPIAEELANTSLSLPIWPGMTNKMVSQIAENIFKFVG